MMPFCGPSSTQRTQTIAAAISAPIAIQIATRMTPDSAVPFGSGTVMAIPALCGSPPARSSWHGAQSGPTAR